nr:VP4 [Tupaia hepatovirus A]
MMTDKQGLLQTVGSSLDRILTLA